MITPTEKDWLIGKISGLIEEKSFELVSDHAETYRILPPGTPFPGPWQNSRTPYLVEPMDSASDISDVEVDVWLKSHQMGFTAAVENIIQYIIKVSPGPILYTTATDTLGKEWSETRFDPMIEQCGMANMIFSQSMKKGGKKTGDKTLLKEFPGGRIKITGYQSSGALRSSSFRFFFGDEIDEAPVDLKKQGDPLSIAKGRTSAYKSKRKMILFSTPTEKSSSKIYAAYLLGDKRKYHVPCPYCGFKQELDFKNLVYVVDDDGILDPDSVKYKCQNEGCAKFFYNYHKASMYESGKCEWIPTAKAKRANYISRHISCLYSPPGMITWSDMVQEYLSAKESEDEAKMKAFETLYLGWPYEEKGEKPDYQKVIRHRSNYKSGTIPDGVLFLTLGADVQGDRVELEVCGHGRKFRTWSIDYVVIPGNTEIISEGAWPKFKDMFNEGNFVYQKNGMAFAPQMAFIDSNYRTDTVVEFCETVTGLYPIVGQDKFSNPQQKFRISNLPGSTLQSIRLASNYFKDRVYSALNTKKAEDGKAPANYPEFPYDYPDKYFRMLNAEYKRGKRVGSVIKYEYYCPPGTRNEALDCRYYNIGAREVIFSNFLVDQKENIEEFEKQVGRKITPKEKTDRFYDLMEKTGSFEI